MLKTMLRWCLIFALGCHAFPSAAQVMQDYVPPFKYGATDERHISLPTGTYMNPVVDLSIGEGDFPNKLEFSRRTDPANDHNLLAYIDLTSQGPSNTTNAIAAVYFRGKEHRFIISGPNTWTPIEGDGSQLNFIAYGGSTTFYLDTSGVGRCSVPNGYFSFQDSAGGTLIIELAEQYRIQVCQKWAAKQYIAPDGASLIYNYYAFVLSTGMKFNSLKSIQNSRGFGITLNYSSDNLLLQSAQTTVQCTGSAARNCGQGTLQSVQYEYQDYIGSGFYGAYGANIFRALHYVHDAAGGVTEYLFSSMPYPGDYYTQPGVTIFSLSSIKAPGATAPVQLFYDWQYSYQGGLDPFGGTVWASKVNKVRDEEGREFTYVYNLVDQQWDPIDTSHFWNFFDATVSGASGVMMKVEAGDNGGPVRWGENALQQRTTYGYDSYDRLTSVTAPEGDIISMVPDSRGNITELRLKAKPGTGLADIVRTAGYDSCTSANFRTCNKPTYIVGPYIDGSAAAPRADFQYDAGHGGLVVKLNPADSQNMRAVTRYGYGSFSPAPGLTIPSGMTLPSTYLTTTEDRCLTSGVTGTTIDFSYVCPAASRLRTSYTYVASTTSQPSNFDLASTTVDDGGLTLTTSYVRDAIGNVISIDGPMAGTADTSRIRYDILRREVGEVLPDPDGGGSLPRPATRTSYSARGEVLSVDQGTVADASDAAWSAFAATQTVGYAYDQTSRKLQETRSSAGTSYAVTRYAYDGLGRLTCAAVRMNLASLPADACTAGTAGSAGPDRITKTVYDAAGQVVQLRKAVGTAIEQAYATYSYTPNGKQEYVIDAGGNRAKQEYDGFDRESKWIFPSPTKPTAYNPSSQANALASAGALNTGDYEQYGYDANGNRVSLRKRSNQTINYGYDALNRLTQKGGAAATVNYVYDLANRQLSAKFAGGDGITNSYDGADRLLSSTTAMNGGSWALTYQYDAAGNRTRITHPDGKYFVLGYDGVNRMNNAQWNNLNSGLTQFMSIGFNANGTRSTINRASSYTDYGYDGISRLTSLTQRFAGNAGNLTQGFGYNPANQITSLSRSADEYAWTANYNVNRNYTANGLNQYSQISSSATLNPSYDANGNLTGDGSTAYVYDAENRLASASGAKTLSLAYDPLGRLFQISGGAEGTVRFVYDGDHVAAEYDGNNAMLRRYMWGPGADEPILWDEGSALDCSGTKVLQPDHQGSTIALANCGGQRTAIDSYDPNGIPAPSNVGRFQYTGQAWLPDIGMYYYKARIYSPTLGRFLQTDPIGYQDQINLYAYVANDPVNKTDLTGNESGSVSYNSSLMLAEAAEDNPPDPTAAKWMIGGTIAAISCAVGCEAVPALYRAWRFERRMEQVREKLPNWKETPNKKGEGSRFQDPADKGNRVRVDKGNPDHKLPSQRPDHVVEQRGGKTVDAAGKPIEAPKPASTPEAHIPLKDWLNNFLN